LVPGNSVPGFIFYISLHVNIWIDLAAGREGYQAISEFIPLPYNCATTAMDKLAGNLASGILTISAKYLNQANKEPNEQREGKFQGI